MQIKGFFGLCRTPVETASKKSQVVFCLQNSESDNIILSIPEENVTKSIFLIFYNVRQVIIFCSQDYRFVNISALNSGQGMENEIKTLTYNLLSVINEENGKTYIFSAFRNLNCLQNAHLNLQILKLRQ